MMNTKANPRKRIYVTFFIAIRAGGARRRGVSRRGARFVHAAQYALRRRLQGEPGHGGDRGPGVTNAFRR